MRVMHHTVIYHAFLWRVLSHFLYSFNKNY
jgi:hypothetical protein